VEGDTVKGGTMNEINRELTELLGVPRHEIVKWGDECRRWTFCSCGKRFKSHSAARIHARNLNNFTSSDGKIELLRLMDKREDRVEFVQTLYLFHQTKRDSIDSILSYITDTTGLLAQVAVEFLRRETERV
jgi:hypothetical protein